GVREVFGVAASTTTGDPFWAPVLSFGCSSRICFGKTANALISSSGESVDAPPGPAIFAIDGVAALIYFPVTQQLFRWHDGQIDLVDFNPGGEVLSLRAVPGGVDYVVRRADGIWAGDRNFGDASAAALLNNGSVLVAKSNQLRVIRPDDSEVDF